MGIASDSLSTVNTGMFLSHSRCRSNQREKHMADLKRVWQKEKASTLRTMENAPK